jgi:hypothetical protein
MEDPQITGSECYVKWARVLPYTRGIWQLVVVVGQLPGEGLFP